MGEMEFTPETAMIDMMAGKLTQYLSAVGAVLVYYDGFLTIEDEMRFVWPGPLNFPKILYYINRYLTAVLMIFISYHVAALRPDLSLQFCHASVFLSGTALVITTTASTVLLTLRVTALYGSARWVVWLLWLGFALFHGLRVVVLFFGEYVVFRAVVYSPINHICEISRIGNRSTAFMAIIPAAFDLALLILTAYKALRSPISLKSNSILFTLLRDELLFFFIISSLRVTNALIYLFLPPWCSGILIYAEWGLESVFTARFFLNLRSIAHYQTPEVFESHPRPFESTPLRTRATQKPGRRVTNNFIDLEIRKTVYSSGASPNEGEIEQADI